MKFNYRNTKKMNEKFNTFYKQQQQLIMSQFLHFNNNNKFKII